jgi:hypothetical protein
MLEKLLKKRSEIAKAWREYFLSRYPSRPPIEIVEYIDDCTSEIVKALVEKDFKGVEKPLDELMRYLATDSKLSAGGSVGTIFHLRDLILKKIPDLSRKELEELNRRLDILVCKAFDLYVNAREDLFRLKYKQMEFELKAQMKQYEFCMKHCPYAKKIKEMGHDSWDVPPDELEKSMKED